MNPPAETVLFHNVPLVARITPKLPRLAEIIRRNSRNCYRVEVIVKVELSRILPNVSAIPRNIKRHVPDDLNLKLLQMLVKCRNLTEEYPLIELLTCYLLRVFGLELSERGSLTVLQVVRPLIPRYTAVHLLYDAEQCERFKPFRTRNERPELRHVTLAHVLVGSVEYLGLESSCRLVVNTLGILREVIFCRELLEFVSSNHAFVNKNIRAHKKMIPRERTRRTVRRVSAARVYCRHWENLPYLLTRVMKELCELQRFRPEITNAVF